MSRVLAPLLALVLLTGTQSHVARVEAQVPPSPNPRIEAQALAIERQLLCPLCANERLDICATTICIDMKRIIREQLTAGASPDEVIFYFEQRYGERVRVDLHRDGFNLILFGWVGSSVLLVAAAGTWFLVSARRASLRAHPARAALVEDPWLDAEVTDRDEPSEASG